MEEYLICGNPKCRFLLSLREGSRLYSPSELPLRGCPKCGHSWSANCPFCGLPLESNVNENQPSCTHCGRSLLPEGS